MNHRNPAEAAIIRELFDASFPDIYRYACQSLTFKMDVLEAFVIRQVSYSVVLFLFEDNQRIEGGKDNREPGFFLKFPLVSF